MKVYLGADHRGYQLKERIKKILSVLGYSTEDFGNDRLDPEDDYPDFAIKVGKKLSKNPKDRGILVCGSGVGVDIVANRFPFVRCGLSFSRQQVRLARRDDDINCLALASDFVSEDEIRGIVENFMETTFSGDDKYLRRIKKIDKIRND